MGHNVNNIISKKLGAMPDMHARNSFLASYLRLPTGLKINLIPVDSGCTVSNINDSSVIHPSHRMSASRPVCVADKGKRPLALVTYFSD